MNDINEIYINAELLKSHRRTVYTRTNFQNWNVFIQENAPVVCKIVVILVQEEIRT